MDPNETLSELREVVELHHKDELIEEGHTLDYVPLDYVLERIEALDEWLIKGGALPDSWAEAGANR